MYGILYYVLFLMMSYDYLICRWNEEYIIVLLYDLVHYENDYKPLNFWEKFQGNILYDTNLTRIKGDISIWQCV